MTTVSTLGAALTIIRATAPLVFPKTALTAGGMPSLVPTSALVERIYQAARTPDDKALLKRVQDAGSPVALRWEVAGGGRKGVIGYVPLEDGGRSTLGVEAVGLVVCDVPGAFRDQAVVERWFAPALSHEQVLALRKDMVASGVDPDRDDDDDGDRDEDHGDGGGDGGDGGDGDKIPSDRDGGSAPGADEEELRRRIGGPGVEPRRLTAAEESELARVYGTLVVPFDPRVTDPPRGGLRELSTGLSRALGHRVALGAPLAELKPGALPVSK